MTNSSEPSRPDQCPRLYWALGAALVLYVALCTSFRDNLWGADAWEHHRAVLVLSDQMWSPTNPTFARPEPSIRYSPYSVALAFLCRVTQIDPYDALSVAAVVNTALLVVTLFLFLRAYSVSRIGVYALVATVSLYGGAPGYANSCALADLPWHQVNPSALSWPFVLLMWSLFRAAADSRRSWRTCGIITILGACALLTHGPTAAFGFLGMHIIVATAPSRYRKILGWRLLGIVVGAGALCVLWPWYNFCEALLSRRDPQYWFLPGVLILILTQWGAPALLISLTTLQSRRHEFVRFCLITAAVGFGLACVSFLTKSATLARLPMLAILVVDLPIAMFMYEAALLRPTTWRERTRRLWSLDKYVSSRACVEVMVAIVLLCCLLPQLWNIARSPHLARAFFAPLLGQTNKQLDLKSTFDLLLAPIRSRDVVLSDLVTSWPVPSFRGRIVTALHAELFVPNQPQRVEHVDAFFTVNDAPLRRRILEIYDVDWILLNRERLDEAIFDDLLESDAIVSHVGGLVLMNAARWRALRDSGE